MSGVGVDEVIAEQDFEACVVEWEDIVGLWDQLVGETLALSGDGFPLEVVGQDGALEGWEVAFASVHRRMLLAASVEFWDDEDEASALIVSTSSSIGDRGAAIAEGCGQVLVGGLRRDVADGSGLALGAELVWSATSGEVSAANSLSSGLRLWRSMARVARELSEAKVWSRQLVQWMMRSH